MTRTIGFLLLGGIFLNFTLSGCSEQANSSLTKEASKPTIRTVDVFELQPKMMSRSIRLTGELYPYESVDIFAKVPGFVESVYVDRGDSVEKGQLLARLNAPELGSQITQAKAQVQASHSQIAEANAKYQSELATYQRLKAASETPGVIAENELIQAQKTVEAARANVSALAGSARSAQANVRSVQSIQGYLQLRAPFAGVVTQRNLHPGALVGPGGGLPLLRVEKISPLRLVVAVPEKHLGSVRNGAMVRFTVPAYPEKSFFGKVSRISHSLDPRTRTEAIELSVDNRDGKLSPGMYAEINWTDQRRTPIVTVPSKAIVSTTERTFVIRIRDNKAEWVDVKRGVTFGEAVEVIGLLEAGDQIVARATDEIRNGSSIQPKLVHLEVQE